MDKLEKVLKWVLAHINVLILLVFIELNLDTIAVLYTVFKHDTLYIQLNGLTWAMSFLTWTSLRVLRFKYNAGHLHFDD
ncbi:hypothetical protein [Heyndrickxia acidicola]|uniref:Uncharacterized protein n=1 Tax=Heyndrickxia acidicola TaxID=209389 RepID=A0ABU6MKF9_9BACI|nr:hypothetical protein [Heyndrickxia acidicola]MED1204133.1 hypothetical protein [Heyndrickxia acidicola]